MNAANLLTLSRLLLIAPIVILMYSHGPVAAWAALGLFLVAMLTDVFDGMLARRHPSPSPLGNYLDPVADKVLLLSLFICLTEWDVVPVWVALVLVAREFVVSGVRSVGAVQGVVIGANWMGKAKTFLQTVTVAVALLGGALAAAPQPAWGAVDAAYSVARKLAYISTAAAVLFALIFLYWNRRLLLRTPGR